MDAYNSDRIRSNLPLLKKLERARLRDLSDSIGEEERRGMVKLPQRHTSKKVLWEWQADDGSWQPFEKEEQARLEHAAESGLRTIPFVDSIHFMQTVDLTCMQMVNMKTGIGKRIRRTPELDLAISSNLYERSKGSYRQSSRFSSNGWNFGSDEHEDEDEGHSRLVTGRAHRRNVGLDPELFSSSRRWSESRISPRVDDDDLNVLGESGLLSTVSTPRVAEWSRYSGRGAIPRAVGSRNYVEVGKTKRKKSSPKELLGVGAKGQQLQPKTSSNQEGNRRMKQWLLKINLDEYSEKFKREKVTLKEARALNEEDLKKLGLPMGARKRFLESAKELKAERDPPNEYLCPITMSIMKDPVILSDGFTYERKAIEQWLKGNHKSPMTNQGLDNENVTPNRQLKKLIEDFKAINIDD